MPHFGVPQNVAGKTDRKSRQRYIGKEPGSDDWVGSNFGLRVIGLQERLQVKLVAMFIQSVALGARWWDIIRLSCENSSVEGSLRKWIRVDGNVIDLE